MVTTTIQITHLRLATTQTTTIIRTMRPLTRPHRSHRLHHLRLRPLNINTNTNSLNQDRFLLRHLSRLHHRHHRQITSFHRS